MPDPQPAAPVNSYDEVPYESHPYAQTHPSRLNVVATLFGLNPKPVENCRVLELGSAGGGNLVPMAEGLPHSWFVGIDLSARQISDGERLIHQLGLKNVSLRHASILDVDASYGQFDYIICHGVFSWVPTAVRDKILDICAKNLTPEGVAYISYNTYPGWHMRGMIRDMMRYHAMRFSTPKQRTEQARALLDFLAQSVRQEGPYSVLLKTELETLRHQADHYLYHEHLEEVNEPLYFHQFEAMAKANGLRYLGESRIGTMVTGNFGPEVEQTLRKLAPDQIQTEQYMDFLRNRMFRETLLVPQAAVPSWEIKPQTIRKLHLASSGKPAANAVVDVASDASVQYQTRSGMTLSTGKPLLKAAMQVFAERWPETISFDDLAREARTRLGGGTADAAQREADAASLAPGLLNSYISSDLVELHASPIRVMKSISERPCGLPSAVNRSAAGIQSVGNRRHEVVRLNDIDHRVLPLLDGTRTRAVIVDRLTELALAGDLNVQRDSKPLSDPADIRSALDAIIEPVLNNLASQALLVG